MKITPEYDYFELQKQTEQQYSRKHVLRKIRDFLFAEPEIQCKITQGAELLKEWLSSDHHKSKQKRLAELRDFDLEILTRDVITHSSIILKPELFVSFTSQLAHSLNFSDRADAIATVAEIVVVLAQLDAYYIIKPSREASLQIQSRINLPHEMQEAVQRSHYLPPMLIEPDLITNNYQSPYLTFNDCQILGKGNGHTGEIGLDVINTQNDVQLTLNEQFLKTVEEEPSYELDSLEKQQGWAVFKRQSKDVYDLIIETGNVFWETHKVDKRGRLYVNGYHVTTMGTPYKKAMIDLAKQELVTGVPNQQRKR